MWRVTGSRHSSAPPPNRTAVLTARRGARSAQADLFRTDNYNTEMKQPSREYLAECIPGFFAPHGEALPGALANCSRRPGRIDFIHAPLFGPQSNVRAQLCSARGL